MPVQLAKTKKPNMDHDFDQDCFIPAVYNKTYYSSVMQDEMALIKWQAGPLDKLIRRHLLLHGMERFPLMFDAGSGPSVHHLLALAKYTDEIHLADYMKENLAEIEKWVGKDPSAHDWTLFVKTILSEEGQEPSAVKVSARTRDVRRKITNYSLLDLKKAPSRLPKQVAPFVTSFFVADSATKSKNVFAKMTKNAFQLVADNGLFVATYLGGCKRYRVGRKWINSASITEDDIRHAFLMSGAKKVAIWRFNTPKMDFDGFDHIFAVVAEK